MTDPLSPINLLQGTLPTPPQVVSPLRIDQTMIIPGSIKPRHLEKGLFAVYIGLDKNRPTKGDVYSLYLANDTKKLYFWNGTLWTSITFS